MIPRTQRAARVHGPRDLRIDEVPTPEAGPGEVLVEISSVGVCGSDVHFYEEARIGPTVIDRPLILGHEPAGTVAATGPGAEHLAVGQRVTLEPGVPCGRCLQCRTGQYNLCPEIAFFAFPPTDGALTQFVTIDERFAHPVPDSISDDEAALIEPLAVAVWAVRKAQIRHGQTVTVTGAGPIGLLCIQLARLAGGLVTASDTRPAALELASTFGAATTVDPSTQALPEAELHLECSGNPSAIFDGIDALLPGGTAILVGVGPDRVEIPLTSLRRRELTVTSTFRYAHIYPDAIGLVERGDVALAPLVTDRYPLGEAGAAFENGLSPDKDRSTIKAVIEIADQ